MLIAMVSESLTRPTSMLNRISIALIMCISALGNAQAERRHEMIVADHSQPASASSCIGASVPPDLPAEVAVWATVRCTDQGQVFAQNEHYKASLDGDDGAIFASIMDGSTNYGPSDSSFAEIKYTPVNSKLSEQSQGRFDGTLAQAVANARYRIDLKTAKGNQVSLLVSTLSENTFTVWQADKERLIGIPLVVASKEWIAKKKAEMIPQ